MSPKKTESCRMRHSAHKDFVELGRLQIQLTRLRLLRTVLLGCSGVDGCNVFTRPTFVGFEDSTAYTAFSMLLLLLFLNFMIH